MESTLKPSHHNVLREEVFTEGAIIKVDLIKCLLCQLNHITLVVAPIFVLADHSLACTDFPHGLLFPLLEKKKVVFPQRI